MMKVLLMTASTSMPISAATGFILGHGAHGTSQTGTLDQQVEPDHDQNRKHKSQHARVG